MNKNWFVVMIIACCCQLAGCDSADERLARFAAKSVEQQAQQNVALAQANDDMHAERTSLNGQQAALEQDRREMASQRVRDPLIANAIEVVGLTLACLAPLLICAYALKQTSSTSPECELGSLLIEELTDQDSMLLPPLPVSGQQSEILGADGASLIGNVEGSDGQ